MRLPRIDTDSWELRSAEESHRLNPDTFSIPPREAREGLRRGQAARLIFDIETDDGGRMVVGGERMWVIVADKQGDTYIGILDNQPATVEPGERVYLASGRRYPFARSTSSTSVTHRPSTWSGSWGKRPSGAGPGGDRGFRKGRHFGGEGEGGGMMEA